MGKAPRRRFASGSGAAASARLRVSVCHAGRRPLLQNKHMHDDLSLLSAFNRLESEAALEQWGVRRAPDVCLQAQQHKN